MDIKIDAVKFHAELAKTFVERYGLGFGGSPLGCEIAWTMCLALYAALNEEDQIKFKNAEDFGCQLVNCSANYLYDTASPLQQQMMRELENNG